MNGIQADLQWTHCLLIIVVKENQLYKIQVDLDKRWANLLCYKPKTGQVNLSRQGRIDGRGKTERKDGK